MNVNTKYILFVLLALFYTSQAKPITTDQPDLRRLFDQLQDSAINLKEKLFRSDFQKGVDKLVEKIKEPLSEIDVLLQKWRNRIFGQPDAKLTELVDNWRASAKDAFNSSVKIVNSNVEKFVDTKLQDQFKSAVDTAVDILKKTENDILKYATKKDY